MKSRNQITAFYVEALLLILVFVAIILVLTHVFGLGMSESSEANILTDSVTLAQNSAEAVAASDSSEELEEILSNSGLDRCEIRSDGKLEVVYDADLVPLKAEDGNKEGTYKVLIDWEEDQSDAAMISANISVYYRDSEKPSYVLETAKYRKGAAS